MTEFATRLIWENQTFPEPRLATIVVERPISIIAKLFGVWENDIKSNFSELPDRCHHLRWSLQAGSRSYR
jgi:hypothetical protein